MNWKAISDEHIAAGEAVHSGYGTLISRNANEIATRWPRQHSFAWFQDYNEAASGVQGLQVHTPPYFWKALPLPISPFGPHDLDLARRRVFRVSLLYKTIPSFYDPAGRFGGKVDVVLGTNLSGPPSDYPLYADTTTFADTNPLESTTNAYQVATLEVPAWAPSAHFEENWPGVWPVLYIRSQLGEQVDLPAAVLTGIKLGRVQDGWSVTRRTMLECPVTFFFLVPDGEAKPALTGRILRKRTRAQGPELSSFTMPMLPWPQFYFVEHENLILEEGDTQDYTLFTMPPMPQPVFRSDVGRNAAVAAAGGVTSDEYLGFDGIFESTGIVIKSVLVEEAVEDP